MSELIEAASRQASLVPLNVEEVAAWRPGDSARRRLFSPSLIAEPASAEVETDCSPQDTAQRWPFRGVSELPRLSPGKDLLRPAPMLSPVARELPSTPSTIGVAEQDSAVTRSFGSRARLSLSAPNLISPTFTQASPTPAPPPTPPPAPQQYEPRLQVPVLPFPAARAGEESSSAASGAAADHAGQPLERRAARSLSPRRSSSTGRGSSQGSLTPGASWEAPPRGCVAEKVSIFEQRCQTPGSATRSQRPSLPEALRRGPRSQPVSTPLGPQRQRRDSEVPSLSASPTGGTSSFVQVEELTEQVPMEGSPEELRSP